MKNFELKSFPNDVELARAAAQDWRGLLAQSSAPHLIAVSGGRIAQTFFSAVTEMAETSGVSFKNVHFFWADERCVPPDHPDSNFRIAEEHLLQPLAIALDKIHRIKGELPPEEAVAEANAALHHIAPQNSGGVPVLDLILLGLGENGHTASLMPNAPPAEIQSHAPYLYVANSPKPPPERVSMSYATLAAAKNVWMLAAGQGKEDALRQSLQPKGQTPFARVLHSRVQTVIYSDIAV
ncbi:MAG TPA: 6-phosphogluconolactonase [Candidatus Saccharimonadales bacterium]|nr:6-phosphogluconolactonase [Candidatus Saccharimonadales bacterium]